MRRTAISVILTALVAALLGTTGQASAAPPAAWTAKQLGAAPGARPATLVSWIHSNARVWPSSHVGDADVGDWVAQGCYVYGDTVNGNDKWDVLFDYTTRAGGFVPEAYIGAGGGFCGSEGHPTDTFVSPVWQHSWSSVSATHVGDVGDSSNLRGYAVPLSGDPYPSPDGSTTWWFVFDPSVYNFVGGFVPCSLLTSPSLYCLY